MKKNELEEIAGALGQLVETIAEHLEIEDVHFKNESFGFVRCDVYERDTDGVVDAENSQELWGVEAVQVIQNALVAKILTIKNHQQA